MFASKSEGGFFDPSIHARMPADAVELTDGEYAELLEGQAAGKLIDFAADGFPFLADPPEPPALTRAQIQALRQAAYARESDPLKNEADYDALVSSAAPDYAAWLAKVAEIKERYPLPPAE